jgi:hypothetical protein
LRRDLSHQWPHCDAIADTDGTARRDKLKRFCRAWCDRHTFAIGLPPFLVDERTTVGIDEAQFELTRRHHLTHLRRATGHGQTHDFSSNDTGHPEHAVDATTNGGRTDTRR